MVQMSKLSEEKVSPKASGDGYGRHELREYCEKVLFSKSNGHFS